MRAMLAVMSGLALAGCSVVGIRTGLEEPPFTVVQRLGGLEIRQYGPRIAAQVTVDGDEDSSRNAGFRKVAGYIFGDNQASTKIAMTAPVAQSSEKIAMTAPVAQARTDAGWTIRFFMPSQYTMQTLPKPNDPDVKLVEVPGQTMAVLRYTGFIGADTVATQRARLLALLKSSPYTAQGEPISWFYDPPWTIPFLRRNEVAVQVTQ